MDSVLLHIRHGPCFLPISTPQSEYPDRPYQSSSWAELDRQRSCSLAALIRTYLFGQAVRVGVSILTIKWQLHEVVVAVSHPIESSVLFRI